MAGVRVAPDNNDVCVWRLDESGPPFVNSSTSPSSAGATANLTNLGGSPLLQQPSLFAASGTNSCVQFTGNNSGTRNTIFGGNNFLPQPPMTISGWMMIRNYDTTGFTQHGFVKQTTTGVWSGSTFATITCGQNERYNGGGLSNTSRFDFGFTTNASSGGGNANTSPDNTIPLNTWTHIGATYDGTTVLSYVNGNNISSSVASPTGNLYYSGTPGPWFIGAIPSGSGNPEECNMSFCDWRVANIIRTQPYFQNIYQNGVLNSSGQISVVTVFYKMRAYDIYCKNPTPVYWVDTTVSYAAAPAPACGGVLGPIEVVETWSLLNT
jgi:hypothetical protein